MAESALKSKGETSEAPPLTLDTVVRVVHGVRDWKKFGKWLFILSGVSDRDARLQEIKQQHDSDGNYLYGVVEEWFKGHRQSWRQIISALDWVNESVVADRIRGYAEPPPDPTLTPDRVAAVMDEIKDWRKLGMQLIPLHVVDDHRYPTVREKKHAVGNYYVQTDPDASWVDLTMRLYCANEYSAVEKAKQHLPKADPTLTTSNMLSVLSGVEERWEELCEELLVVPSVWRSKRNEIRQLYHSSTDRIGALINFYIAYDPTPSWQLIASALQKMGLQDLADVVTTKYVRGTPLDLYAMNLADHPDPEENYLSEEDLIEITDHLLPLEKTHVYNLGLVLGISQHKTKTMMDSSTFLDDVIAAWLRREDQVNKKGEPSWTVLVRALEHPRVGQCGISHNIRKDKGLH